MARKVAGADPALAIEFWLSGFYTHRSQLFAPFKGIGVNVVSFHDPVIDGQNMEDTDLYEWSRRPAFSIFCSQALPDTEIVRDFYSFRNFTGTVVPMIDTSLRLAKFDTSSITSIITKSTTSQGFVTNLGDMLYFSDGAGSDLQKWDSATAFSAINPSTWGLAAPTSLPGIYNRGCWLPKSNYVVNNAILDPNGSVEVVTSVFGSAGISGANEPLWPTTAASTINDGSVQWTNMGPLLSWLPDTNFPVPVVILDTNGNLQLATTTTSGVSAWNSATTYNVGQSTFYAGLYWTSLISSNTNIPPNSGYSTSTVSGSTTTLQPAWVLASNPITTGSYPSFPYAPAWNKTVGGTTTDGAYVWKNLGPGQLIESYGTSYVYCYRTIYGHLTTASPISINTGSIFGPAIAAITAFQIAGNTVTFTGVNNFVPGNVFTVQGLTTPNGQVLNNQAFTVISAGLSPTQFSAVFTYPNVALTADFGSTENLVAQVTGVGTTSPLCNAQVSITATQVTADIVRIYAVNTFVPGLYVTFTGLTVATFLNNTQFQIINVDPNDQWFEVFCVTENQNLSTDTGLATFNAVEIYRTSDGGGIYLFSGAVTNPSGSAIITPYDSGYATAGTGTDNGVPGTDPWINPGNVSSASSYATVHLNAPVSGSTNFNIVQTCGAITTSQATPSGIITSAFGLPVTGQDGIVVFVVSYDVATVNLFDSTGNLYSSIATESSPNDHGVVTITTYLVPAASAGSTTITLQVTGAGSNAFFGFGAMECTGLSGVAEAPNGGYQASGTTLNSGTITTGTANTVVLSYIWSDLLTNSGNSVTAPAGYPGIFSEVVLVPNDGNSYQQIAAAYQVLSSISTVSPTWNTPSNSKALGISVALELATYTPSDGLQATNFSFAVPPSIAVTGIEIDFEGLFDGTGGSYSVQLLKNGSPAGLVATVTPTAVNQNFVLGGANNLWNATWTYADFNNSAFGVQIIANTGSSGSAGTYSVRNVRARITGQTSTTGWVFNDFTTDDNLNPLLIAPQFHQNDPPPGANGSTVSSAGIVTAYWNGRIWMAVGNYVYFSAGPDCTNGVPEEAWPPSNRFQFTGPVLGLIPSADGTGLLVYLADRVNAILGGPETISFYPTDALTDFGISSPNGVFKDRSVIGQFTTQKQYFEILGSNIQEISEHIADYVAANFKPAQSYVTMHRNGEDVGVFISNGSDRIVRYGSNIGAWSVPAFPVFGAGALRSIETSVGVNSLMLATPNGGVTTNTPLIFPRLGQSKGTGTAWTNPNNITLGNPAAYAVGAAVSISTQQLTASEFPFNIPSNSVVRGIVVKVTGQQTVAAAGLTITPLNAVSGAESDTFALNIGSNSTATLGGITDTWSMPTWTSPSAVNANSFGFAITGVPIPGVPYLNAKVSSSGSGTTINTVFNPTLNGRLGLSPYNVGDLIVDTNSNVQRCTTAGTTAISSPTFATTVGVQTVDGTVTWTCVKYMFSIGDSIIMMSGFAANGPNQAFPVLSVADNSGGGTTYSQFAAISFIDTGGIANPGEAWIGKLTVNVPYGTGITVSTTYTGSAVGSAIFLSAMSNIGTYSGKHTANSGTGTTWSSGSLTIASNEMVFSLGGCWNTSSIAAPFTNLGGIGTGGNNIGLAYAYPGVAGSISDSWTQGFSNPFTSEMVSFTVQPQANTYSISEVQVEVYYQTPGNFLYARDLNNWADCASFGVFNGAGTPYSDCYITVGSITLSQPGAALFPLQHVVGYFDAVGTLGDGGVSSQPNIWILPNEISDTKGIGFIQLPEVVQEPPVGQNQPSTSIQSLRWPVNMMNSASASQFVHHLQVKIQFEPENAPNTIKAISFKENQE